MDTVVAIITASLSSVGFGIVFNLRGKLLFMTSIGGFVCWCSYLLVQFLLVEESIFIPCLVATIVGIAYTDIISRRFKTPMMVLFLPVLVPLFPGGSLYYTFYYFCQSDWPMTFSYAAKTFISVFAIAMGVTAIKLGKDTVKTIKHKSAAKKA